LKGDCLIRLRSNFNKLTKQFIALGKDEAIVVMSPGQKRSLEDKAYTKTTKLKVRLLRLPTGSGFAYFVTTILDPGYSWDFFQQVYHHRWEVETCYDVLKNVLEAECFSGQSQLSIDQDFYICILLLNIQNLLSYDLQERIDEKYKKGNCAIGSIQPWPWLG
jgi:hypothetical protein